MKNMYMHDDEEVDIHEEERIESDRQAQFALQDLNESYE